MSPFDRAHTTSYSTLIETIVYLYRFLDIAGYLWKVADFDPPHLHFGHVVCSCTRWAKKWGHRLMTIILSHLNRRLKNFTGRFLGKFIVKWILKIPPHLAYVAALPCETLMSAKQATKDKLQVSVPTHWRCGEIVNNQLRKGLLLSLLVKFSLNL